MPKDNGHDLVDNEVITEEKRQETLQQIATPVIESNDNHDEYIPQDDHNESDSDGDGSSLLGSPTSPTAGTSKSSTEAGSVRESPVTRGRKKKPGNGLVLAALPEGTPFNAAKDQLVTSAHLAADLRPAVKTSYDSDIKDADAFVIAHKNDPNPSMRTIVYTKEGYADRTASKHNFLIYLGYGRSHPKSAPDSLSARKLNRVSKEQKLGIKYNGLKGNSVDGPRAALRVHFLNQQASWGGENVDDEGNELINWFDNDPAFGKHVSKIKSIMNKQVADGATEKGTGTYDESVSERDFQKMKAEYKSDAMDVDNVELFSQTQRVCVKASFGCHMHG